MRKTRCILLILFILVYSVKLAAQSVSVENKGDSVIISNNSLSLAFSNSSIYGLLKMEMNSKDLLNKIKSTHPWEITYIGPNGENPVLQPRNGYYKGVEIKKENDYATLIFTWEMLLQADKTYPVRMHVTLRKDTELAEWNIEAELPQGWLISAIDFPRISIAKPQNAKTILSGGWGAEYNLGNYSILNSRYPSGTGTMQLVLVHDGYESFYYATLDKDASDKRYSVKSSTNDVIINTYVITSEEWSPKDGGTFRLPWTTVTGYNNGGWEKAVTEWYRPFTYTTEWGSKSLESRNLPRWIYNADMWLRPMNVDNNVMEAVRKAMKVFGKDVGIHWYYWHNYPFDTRYPEYFPAKDGFVKMVKETKKLGGYVTPYINGRLWDPDTESYKAMNGTEASCRKADGTLYTEVYSSKAINTVTCPASPIWRDIQKNLIVRIQEELGTSGVYIDQVAAAASEPCWADNHGHAKGGGDFWHYAYRSLYTDIRSNHLEQGNILTSEENAECYIDLFDMLLIVNSPIKSSKLVPLFPLVYSDRAITSAYAYTPGNLTTGYFRYLNMMSLLWGAQLGWVDPISLMKEESKEELAFLKHMVDFRKKQHDFLNGGQFIKEIIPTGDNPTSKPIDYLTTCVVKGAEWKSSKSDEKVILLVNIDNKPHNVILPDGREVKIEGKQCLSLKSE